jgi:Putative mono-oxygenase ydhR
MTMALITVRCRLRGPVAQFRAGATAVADALAETPGLIWKIWGFAEAQGMVTAYLFESLAKAEDFVAGPIIRRLRQRPEVAEVALELAAVDRDLSGRTGAAPALELSPAAARRLTAGA